MKMDNFKFLIEGIKGYLEGLDAADLYNLTKKHYVTLRLMNDDGSWTTDKLAGIGDELLPKGYSKDQCLEFLDEIYTANSQNGYFMSFINGCDLKDFQRVSSKIKEEGKKVIPDVLGYTLMIQRLSRACVEDWKVFEDILFKFREVRKSSGAFKCLPTFHKIKLKSVDKPSERNYLQVHRTGEIKASSGKWTVAINILEATIADFLKKNRGNSHAGRILFKHRCGASKTDPYTGRGPSRLSPDKKKLQRAYPLPREWAELYQTWNMDFVTRFSDFPYLLPKLFIPQVANIKDDPTSYIYNRAMALIIYLNYASFDYFDKTQNNEKKIDWYDDVLNKKWGDFNAVSADRYAQAVKEAKERKIEYRERSM